MNIAEKEIRFSSNLCELIPLEREHLTDLINSVEDGKLRTLWYTFIPNPENMAPEIERRLNLKETG